MSDFNIKLMAEKLGKSIENLAPKVEAEFNQAIGNLAQAAYNSMVSQVQAMSMDPKNRQDYLRGLQFEQIGAASYMIFLNGAWPTKLEEGFSAYDMKAKLLSSSKTVAVGSRAGQPWVRTAKDGHKYAAVPFSHKPFSKEKSSGDLGADIRKMMAFNRAGTQQRLTKVFKDLDGNPISGKVATVDVPGQPNLKGLTKYQYVHPSGKVSSIYMTFRMVSENSSGWQHPGFEGYGLFKQAEEYVERELNNIIKLLL